jgi:putative intracellular protease/amidase
MSKFAVLLADAFQDSEYFLPKVEVEKLGIETETFSLSKTPVEVYSFFKSIGHLKIDKAIDEADVRDYIGKLGPVVIDKNLIFHSPSKRYSLLH